MSSVERARGVCAAAILSVAVAGCGGSPVTPTGTGGGTTTSAGGDGGGGSTAVEAGGGGSSTRTGTSTVPAFSLEAHTSLTPEKALALTTNLPAKVGDCLAAPFEGTPCDDLDQDGLADAWEDLVIDRYRPLLRFDEQESLVDDASFVVFDVARVALISDSPPRVRAFIMLGYSKDYGSCGFTSHNGDSERVALDLAPAAGGGPGDVIAAGAYTAAHENTDSDHGMLFEGAALGQLTYADDAATGEPRWVVFPSQDKHATYASIDICEDISSIPCFDEDCGPDGAGDPGKYDRLPPFVNAGEEAHPLVSDLASIGFPGDDAWAEQDFCGGLGGSGCSSPVRVKLLVDPFTL